MLDSIYATVKVEHQGSILKSSKKSAADELTARIAMSQESASKFFNEVPSKPSFATFERSCSLQLNSMLDKLATFEISVIQR